MKLAHFKVTVIYMLIQTVKSRTVSWGTMLKDPKTKDTISCSFDTNIWEDRHTFELSYSPSNSNSRQDTLLTCFWMDNNTLSCNSKYDANVTIIGNTLTVCTDKNKVARDGQFKCHVIIKDDAQTSLCDFRPSKDSTPSDKVQSFNSHLTDTVSKPSEESGQKGTGSADDSSPCLLSKSKPDQWNTLSVGMTVSTGVLLPALAVFIFLFIRESRRKSNIDRVERKPLTEVSTQA